MGVLLRSLVELEEAGAGDFFGEPQFDVADLLRVTPDGKGVVASDDGGEIVENDDSGRADEGTVVGAMQSSDRVHAEQAQSVGGVKAVPAVRALAKKLGVDLARVAPSGAGGEFIFGDNARINLVPVEGEDGPTRLRILATLG